ncbi:uncharacterized protein [Argopecten irradians]|uniref:uncharacterized protein n=1 Tax=Argopecten irradians TaxID=31199 RepID=UPI00371D65EE
MFRSAADALMTGISMVTSPGQRPQRQPPPWSAQPVTYGNSSQAVTVAAAAAAAHGSNPAQPVTVSYGYPSQVVTVAAAAPGSNPTSADSDTRTSDVTSTRMGCFGLLSACVFLSIYNAVASYMISEQSELFVWVFEQMDLGELVEKNLTGWGPEPEHIQNTFLAFRTVSVVAAAFLLLRIEYKVLAFYSSIVLGASLLCASFVGDTAYGLIGVLVGVLGGTMSGFLTMCAILPVLEHFDDGVLRALHAVNQGQSVGSIFCAVLQMGTDNDWRQLFRWQLVVMGLAIFASFNLSPANLNYDTVTENGSNTHNVSIEDGNDTNDTDSEDGSNTKDTTTEDKIKKRRKVKRHITKAIFKHPSIYFWMFCFFFQQIGFGFLTSQTGLLLKSILYLTLFYMAKLLVPIVAFSKRILVGHRPHIGLAAITILAAVYAFIVPGQELTDVFIVFFIIIVDGIAALIAPLEEVILQKQFPKEQLFMVFGVIFTVKEAGNLIATGPEYYVGFANRTLNIKLDDLDDDTSDRAEIVGTVHLEHSYLYVSGVLLLLSASSLITAIVVSKMKEPPCGKCCIPCPITTPPERENKSDDVASSRNGRKSSDTDPSKRESDNDASSRNSRKSSDTNPSRRESGDKASSGKAVAYKN